MHLTRVLAAAVILGPLTCQTIVVVPPVVVPAVPAGAQGPIQPGAFFDTPTGFPTGFWYDPAGPAVYVATLTAAYRFVLPAPIVSWVWSGAGGGFLGQGCWDELVLWDGVRLHDISPRLFGFPFELRTYQDPAWTGPPTLVGGRCNPRKASRFPSTRPVGYSFVHGGQFNTPGVFILGLGVPFTPVPLQPGVALEAVSSVVGPGTGNVSRREPAGSVLTQGQVVLAEGDPVAAVAGAVIGGPSALDFPVMNLNGTILVRARMSGGGVAATDDRGYFLGRTGADLQMILRSGQADPTGGLLGAGTTLNTATGPGLSSSPRLSPEGGFFSFGCSMVGPSIVTTGTAATGNNSTAILWGLVTSPNALTVLARRGAFFTTNSNGQTYQFDSDFSAPSHQTSALNSLGRACFSSTVVGGDVVGTTNNLGWLTGTPGNLDWVIRKNDIVAIPGGNAPGTYAMGTLGFNCAINQFGQVLHDEGLLTAGTPPAGAVLATAANNGCVFIYTPGGGNALLMREGDDAANAAPGVTYGPPTLAQGFGSTGQAGFVTSLLGAVTAGVDDQAAYLGGVGTVQEVARRGMSHPSLAAGQVLQVIRQSTAYSDYQGGSMAFYASLSGAGVTMNNDASLWLGRPGAGNLRLIAREGDPAPGFESVPDYISATFGEANGVVQLNNRGQITFSSVAVTVTDTLGSTVYSSCHYCWDPTTGLELLFANGLDTFPTVGGPTIGMSSGAIQFPSGDGSSTLGLTNDGDLCHRVNFTTGGAIVRARLGALDCGPSALSATFGGLHTMKLDAGAANAGQIYVVIAGMSGTRPGFPFGGNQIPLNPDAVTIESINSLTFYPGIPWGTTLGLLDGNGRGAATFTMPPALPQFAGTDLDHAMAVIDLGFNVGFVTPPCGVLLH